MLIVFDWDGTIIDSAAKIVGCMQQAADECSLPILEDEAIKNIIGLSLRNAVAHLYPALDEARNLEVQQAYSVAFKAADKVPCDFFVGVEECLAQLQDDGHYIAVATGKSRRGLDRVLGNLNWEKQFHATRCADETASKPDPLMLHQLMEELNVPAEETIMVGDTEYDLEMAVNAKVASVGVSYGAHAVERLQRHQPLAIVDNLVDIHKLIQA